MLVIHPGRYWRPKLPEMNFRTSERWRMAATLADGSHAPHEVPRPVVFLDENPFNGSSVYPSGCGFVGTDNRAGGKLAAEALFGAIPRKHMYRVLVIGSSGQSERQQAFCERLRQLAPQVKILIDENGSFDYHSAKRRVAIHLDRARTQRYDGIFATNDSMAIGAAEVVMARSTSNAIKIVGFDGISDALRMIDEGRSPFVNTVVQDVPALAEQSLLMLESLLDGTCTEPVRLVEPRLYASSPRMDSFAA